MINAIKDNWWNKVEDPLPPPPPPPPEPVYDWRGIDKVCLKNAGENTGESMYDNLEQYDVNTLAATGVIKDNVIGDPDYIAPVQDMATCPVTVYGWEGYQPYCVTEEYIEPVPDTTPQPPVANCRVHFSGALMSDQVLPPPQLPDNPDDPGDNQVTYTKIYVEDNLSEFVGSGDYSDNEIAFPKSQANTFDGIAIDAGTKLIIYSGKNFTGIKLLDITGPALIYNVKWKTQVGFYGDHYRNDKLRTFSEPLQSTYPQSKRYWSNTNMGTWGTGSCKITCQ